jgi:hypothetical protein
LNDVEVREFASHLCNDRLYGEDEVAAAFIEKNFTLLLLALSRRDILFQLFSQVRLEIVRFRVVPVVLPLRHVFFFLVFSRPLCGSRKNMGGERERGPSVTRSPKERAREKQRDTEKVFKNDSLVVSSFCFLTMMRSNSLR